MRLGAYNCSIKTGTKTFAAYRSKKISERHRHRYEVNNRYKKRLEKEGMVISGINDDLGVVETIELSTSPSLRCKCQSSGWRKVIRSWDKFKETKLVSKL